MPNKPLSKAEKAKVLDAKKKAAKKAAPKKARKY